MQTTGWQGCIQCLNLQVAFRKRATNYRALLREMTYKDKASHVSLTLFDTLWHSVYTYIPDTQTHVCGAHTYCVCKKATNYRALLRKMTYKDKASHASLTLFDTLWHSVYTYLPDTQTHVCSAHTYRVCKEPLITGLFCGKWPIKIRHPTYLWHSLTLCIYIHTGHTDSCLRCTHTLCM